MASLPSGSAVPVIPGLEVLGTAGRTGAWESFLACRTSPGSSENPVMLWRLAPPWRGQAGVRALVAQESATVVGIADAQLLTVEDAFGDMHDPVLVVTWTEGRHLLAVGRACRQLQASIPLGLLAHVLARACRGVEAAMAARRKRSRAAPLLTSSDAILVSYEGVVRVPCVAAVDVLAQVPGSLERLTTSRTATVAPEVLSTGEGDAAAEAFSLAAALYELLTDALPFSGRTPSDVLKAMGRSGPIPPRSINPSVPAELEDVCLQGLAFDPSRRLDLRALHRALEAAASRAGPSGDAALAALMQLLFPPGMDAARAWCARMRFAARERRKHAAGAVNRSRAPTVRSVPVLDPPSEPVTVPPARPEDFENAETELDVRNAGPSGWGESGPDGAPSGVRAIPAPAVRLADDVEANVQEWLEETRRVNVETGFEDARATRPDIPWGRVAPSVPAAPRASTPSKPGAAKSSWWRRLRSSDD